MTVVRAGDRFREVGCTRPRVVEVIDGTGHEDATVFVRLVSGPKSSGCDRMEFLRRALDMPHLWVREETGGRP